MINYQEIPLYFDNDNVIKRFEDFCEQRKGTMNKQIIVKCEENDMLIHSILWCLYDDGGKLCRTKAISFIVLPLYYILQFCILRICIKIR